MSPLMWGLALIFGGLGAVLRFLVDGVVSRSRSGSFPYGTMVVNLSGSVALGLITGLALRGNQSLLLGSALIGAYTTFSTWMLETQRLAEEGLVGPAAANLAFSLVLGLAAAFLGRALGEHL